MKRQYNDHNTYRNNNNNFGGGRHYHYNNSQQQNQYDNHRQHNTNSNDKDRRSSWQRNNSNNYYHQYSRNINKSNRNSDTTTTTHNNNNNNNRRRRFHDHHGPNSNNYNQYPYNSNYEYNGSTKERKFIGGAERARRAAKFRNNVKPIDSGGGTQEDRGDDGPQSPSAFNYNSKFNIFHSIANSCTDSNLESLQRIEENRQYKLSRRAHIAKFISPHHHLVKVPRHAKQRLLLCILSQSVKEVEASDTNKTVHEQLMLNVCTLAGMPQPARIPDTFSDPSKYYQSIGSLILEESRAMLSNELAIRRRRGNKNNDALEVMLLAAHEDILGKKGHKRALLSFQHVRSASSMSYLKSGMVFVLQPKQQNPLNNENSNDFLSMFPVFLSLHVNSGDESTLALYQEDVMPYFLERTSSIIEQQISWNLLPCCTLISHIRQFEACSRQYKLKLLNSILGMKKAVHIRFDTNDENEDTGVLTNNSSDTDEDDDIVYNKESSQAFVVSNSNDNANNDNTLRNSEIIVIDDSDGDNDNNQTNSGDGWVAINDEILSNNTLEMVQNNGTKTMTGNTATSSECKDDDGGRVTVNDNIEVYQEVSSSSITDDSSSICCVCELADLNATQLAAQNDFISSPNHSLMIVQGPPGTGKTTFLSSLIIQLSTNHHRRIMVSAPSNKAILVLATKLSQLRLHTKVKIAMIGVEDKLMAESSSGFQQRNSSNEGLASSSSVDLRDIFVYKWVEKLIDEASMIFKKIQQSCSLQEVMEYLKALHSKLLDSIRKSANQCGLLAKVEAAMVSLHHNITKNDDCNDQQDLPVNNNGLNVGLLGQIREVRDLLAKLIDNEGVIQELIDGASIILCTLSSAGTGFVKRTNPIDDLLVDEAGQAVEGELLIPFLLKPARMLIVGDPKQLPATIISQTAIELGYDRSLHDRLMYGEAKHEYRLLDVQYRMKPEIAAFPSRRFYNDAIQNHSSVCSNKHRSSSVISDGKPYIFIDVHGSEKRTSMGSYFNDDEAEVIGNLLKLYKKEGTEKYGQFWNSPSRIRIITFYQGQVNSINNALRRLGIDGVVVATVDSSQGCEADIVIVSFTRCNSAGNSGFLKDDRRLNVALTRARHQLVCVGSVATLSSGELGSTLSEMIVHAQGESVGAIIDESQWVEAKSGGVQSLTVESSSTNKNDDTTTCIYKQLDSIFERTS